MKRLCFISPNETHTRRVVTILREHDIPEKHIYLLAKEGITLEDLPDAGPEEDDFLPAYERGLGFGGAAGLAAGLYAMVFPPAGLVVGGGAALLITLFGAGLGGFLTGLAGASFPSSRLQEFEQEMENGKILVLVDVPKDEVENYERLIQREDPAVEIHGIEPTAPVIPE